MPSGGVAGEIEQEALQGGPMQVESEEGARSQSGPTAVRE